MEQVMSHEDTVAGILAAEKELLGVNARIVELKRQLKAAQNAPVAETEDEVVVN